MNTSDRSIPRTASTRQRGQVIVIFAVAFLIFLGMSAIVIDVAWYWSSTIRMQRAADAAALAGVVRLPGDEPGAQMLARTEASRNGYTNGAGGVTVNPRKDPENGRQILVSINGPVGTFFARAIGLTQFDAAVTSKAQYTLPVPMGSPENYYGVFGPTRGLTTTTTTTVVTNPSSNTDSGMDVPTTAPVTPGPAVGWTANSGTLVAAVAANDSSYVRTNTNSAYQVFGGFGLTSQLTTQTVTAIRGIEVYLDDYFLSANCSSTTNRIQVQLSWNGGVQWTTPANTNQTASTTTTGTADQVFGAPNNTMSNWVFSGPAHTWQPNDILDANFRVRLTAVKGCATAGTEIRLDQLRVRAYYSITTPTPVTTTTTTAIPDENLKGPGTACPSGVAACFVADGSVLNPRGFWGVMNSQGAANMNGDAHQPYYDNPTSQVAVACSVAPAGTACYDPNEYYNYAIEMPQGSSGGSVYIYDPTHCSVGATSPAPDKGTGDRWYGTVTPITSMFEVWDTNNTLYDRTDDGVGFAGTTPNASSGDLFRNMLYTDTTMFGIATGGAGPYECRRYTNTPYTTGVNNDARNYHNHWYLLHSGMTGGTNGPKVYRVHTTSTDPANASAQLNANGANSFAIYASATGGTPKVYGLGAMQAYTPLSDAGGAAEVSEFYLAQIEAVHATKTVEIQLWDPGDTAPLTASLEILIPTSSGWTATPVTYSGSLGTANPGRADGTSGKPDCRTQTRTTPSIAGISTFTNGGNITGKFNGCWLTIRSVIPANYAADQNGWWKIRYTMSGTGTSNDVTTWKVQILGNPVHLVLP